MITVSDLWYFGDNLPITRAMTMADRNRAISIFFCAR